MPAQKLKNKTRTGSKEIKGCGQPRSPFRRLMESPELPREVKGARPDNPLCTIRTNSGISHYGYLRLRQRLA
jgi:hypothetical protein